MLFIVLALLYAAPTRGLIAYDCGSPNANITTLSLRSIADCKIPTDEPVIKPIYLQLLQLTDYSNVRVIQCKVEVERTIYHCGMHSHVYIVAIGHMDHIIEISVDACFKVHMTEAFAFGSQDVITVIRSNQTGTRSMTLGGKVTLDGCCEGVNYADPYGTWNNVVIQGKYKHRF
ncbi:hypothetical protein KM043_014438 [Ampulex compressa]|nr:hypothetical protein KM043_014438 [Ampulex compressa]